MIVWGYRGERGLYCWLVVGTFFIFFHILGIIIPTDELIFFRGVGIPPTSCIIPSNRAIMMIP
jgi:hypothetical protein